MGKVIAFPGNVAADDVFYITGEDVAEINRLYAENAELLAQINELEAEETARNEREENLRQQELIFPPLAWIREAPVASVVFVMVSSCVVALTMMHIRLMALAG